MKKYFYLLFVVMIAIAWSCGGSQVKTDVSDPNAMFVSSSNDQLSKIPVKGFGYKSSKVPAQEWDRWATAAAPVVKTIIDKLPDGYVLQITGHSDARGPEEPTGKKPGNIKISGDRAKTVFDSLKRKGVESPKLTFKGVGSSEVIDECDAREPCQRRVSFKVVPQE